MNEFDEKEKVQNYFALQYSFHKSVVERLAKKQYKYKYVRKRSCFDVEEFSQQKERKMMPRKGNKK